MENHKRHTLSKKERLNSVNLIEKLFSGGSKSLPAFPLRIVYMLTDNDELPIASVLISVSKKHFKHATNKTPNKRSIPKIQIFTYRPPEFYQSENYHCFYLA